MTIIKKIKRKIKTRIRAGRIRKICLAKAAACKTCDEFFKDLRPLSSAKRGKYLFNCANCDDSLVHRLLEMGFVPGCDVDVCSNSGAGGSIMVEVKGSKLALSGKIAKNIMVKEK